MSKMGFEFDKKISAGTLITLLVIFASVLIGWGAIQSDVSMVRSEQIKMEEFRHEVRSSYVTREQLDFMVIQRLERIENSIEQRLDRIEEKIDNQ